MVINVNVRLVGVYRAFSGRSRTTLTLEEETTVRKAVQKLADSFSEEFRHALIDPELEDPRPNALIIVNGREISVLEGLETGLHEGSEVTIIPVAHSG